MNESDHEWCRDTARDEAVRAAEDAAAVPAIQHRDLPEQVALLWASLGDLLGRVVRLEGEFDAGQDAEASPAVCDSASPAEGLRTERVTLEVTQRAESYAPLFEIDWESVLRQMHRGGRSRGESVRVVEETTIGTGDVFADVQCGSTADEIARLTAERDAAIRERDEALARVAVLEAAPPPRGWMTAEERAAVEEAMVDYASNVGDHDCERIERVLRALLARSTPPKVKMPPASTGETPLVRDLMLGEAIRAAGGEVDG